MGKALVVLTRARVVKLEGFTSGTCACKLGKITFEFSDLSESSFGKTKLTANGSSPTQVRHRRFCSIERNDDDEDDEIIKLGRAEIGLAGYVLIRAINYSCLLNLIRSGLFGGSDYSDEIFSAVSKGR